MYCIVPCNYLCLHRQLNKRVGWEIPEAGGTLENRTSYIQFVKSMLGIYISSEKVSIF